jgi:hypothetical protein
MIRGVGVALRSRTAFDRAISPENSDEQLVEITLRTLLDYGASTLDSPWGSCQWFRRRNLLSMIAAGTPLVSPLALE